MYIFMPHKTYRTYDGLWRESMAELNEQLHVEGVDEEEEVDQTVSPS